MNNTIAQEAKVECVVKPHYRFGDDEPGTHVFIDEKELRNPATMRALYTLEEAYALERARTIKRETRSQMRQLVEHMQESVAEELRELKERAARALDAAAKG
jgi:uncharacterized protein with PIN domain